MNLLNAFRKEWMESIRSYRLLIVSVVLLLFGLTSPILTKLTPELVKLIPSGTFTISASTPTVEQAIGQYVKNIAQDGVILGLLLTMGMVTQEKEKGTAAMMLVKPLPRGSFLGAKFLGLAAVFAISLILAAIATYYYTLILFEAMNVMGWLVLNTLIFIYILVVVAITLFSSTITKSQAAAAGIALGILVIGWLVSSVLGIGKYLPGELVSWGTRLMFGDTTTSWTALGVSFGLIAILLVAAWLVFRRQEL